MVPDLMQAPRAWSPAISFHRLKVSLIHQLWFFFLGQRGITFAKFSVDLNGRLLLHRISHMGIDIQRCSGRHMPQHLGQRFYVHAIFKSHGGE